MTKKNDSKLSKWLEMLQQESWQLELIISGFAIYLVGSLRLPLTKWSNGLEILGKAFENNIWVGLPAAVVHLTWFFLLLNLIFHVVLRGLWISTIGLRYVSGDIDWGVMNLHPKFEKYLVNKVGSYDSFIERLEKLCSIVFAFTFMIIFILISFALFTFFIIISSLVLDLFLELIVPESVASIIKTIIGWIITFSSLLYFIDFITIGWLKRKKWASRIYFPFYKFYGYITLSFLYRPMYYNLIDHQYGRRLAKLLVPYLLLVIIINSFGINYHPYFPDSKRDSNFLSEKFYFDQRTENSDILPKAVIQSKYIKNGFLDLFIQYNHRKNGKSVAKICPNFEPISEIGLSSGLQFSIHGRTSEKVRENPTDTALICMNKLYEIYVNDSLFIDPPYYFFRHKTYGEKGVRTIIDINYLKRGQHLLTVKYQAIERDSLFWKEWSAIPFWKE